MSIVQSEFAPLRDPRLAAQLADHALSPLPVWLWSADGAHILWANPVGAAVFGATTAREAEQRRFDVTEPAAVEVIRLAGSLAASGQARLERLRGFGAGFGRALTCTCTRVEIGDDKPAILIAAAESAGPALTLGERVRRLFADRGQTEAIFTRDGVLLHATAAARTRLDGATTLAALGVDALAAQAVASGNAEGATRFGPIEIKRLGTGISCVLALTFGADPRQASAPESASATSEAAIATAHQTDAKAAPQTAASSEPAPPPRNARDEPQTERRYPLRFVWQMDPESRFVVGSDEFIELVGPRTTAAFGRLWSEIVSELQLDPENLVARAVATRETWSGIIISWPADESSERLPVELSGLPVYDRDRNFRGYRGFGVCRDLGRINRLALARRERPIGFIPPPEPPRADESITAFPAAAFAAGAAGGAPTAPRSEPAIAAAPATAANVVPFRPGAPAELRTPSLSPIERKAFHELAHELAARLRGAPELSVGAPSADAPLAEAPEEVADTAAGTHAGAAAESDGSMPPAREPMLLDRIPVGVLVYRQDAVLYANRHFLQLSGYETLDALASAGGLPALFAVPGTAALAETEAAQKLSILTRGGQRVPVEGRLFALPWGGSPALAAILTTGEAERSHTLALEAAGHETRDLKAMLDAAADGVLMLDRDGNIVAATGSAEALFGRPASELTGRPLGEIFTPESAQTARAYFERFARSTGALQKSMMHEYLEMASPIRAGEVVPLAVTVTKLGADRFCAVLRDITPLKKVEDEMRAAQREAQKASAAKNDFLAKVSHEIRTPLNAITGFAEIIMAERFGPIANERYREYLKDIHAAGTHLAALLNDLLDLSKVEAGQIDLNFGNVSLNELTQQCVGIMQPQASRARIIIRTALTSGLPQVIADERSLRQIVLNLLSNSIRFTGPGGQVIVSTAFADSGEAVLRVRDTGVGMSEKDVEVALAPFQQTATAGSWGSGGTGLGLPLTKALAEANRAHFSIKSAPHAGTLIEVAFPPTRVVAR